jgi:hypothetical protein
MVFLNPETGHLIFLANSSDPTLPELNALQARSALIAGHIIHEEMLSNFMEKYHIRVKQHHTVMWQNGMDQMNFFYTNVHNNYLQISTL